MDLEIIEAHLEDLNRQVNQTIDLVRALRKGELFGEPLPADIKTKLEVQAKTRYDSISDTFTALTAVVNK